MEARLVGLFYFLHHRIEQRSKSCDAENKKATTLLPFL